MYDNIGGKIKGLAKAVFIVEATAALITGIALVAIDEDLILFGLLTLILGPAVAWVSSWLLYGFGELIDRVCEIAQNTRTSQNTPTATTSQEHHDHVNDTKNEAAQKQPQNLPIS